MKDTTIVVKSSDGTEPDWVFRKKGFNAAHKEHHKVFGNIHGLRKWTYFIPMILVSILWFALPMKMPFMENHLPWYIQYPIASTFLYWGIKGLYYRIKWWDLSDERLTEEFMKRLKTKQWR